MIVKVGSTQYKTMADTNVPKPRIKINNEYLELTQDTNLAIKRPRMAVNIGNKKHYIKDVLNPVQFIQTSSNVSGKYWGGALANNGCIYCAPWGENSILKINTENDTFSTFGAFSGGGGFGSSVLAPNGMIYAMPTNNPSILKINPNNDTYSTINTSIIGLYKWIGGVLAPNGMIYAIPYSKDMILKINPNNDTFTTFGEIAEYRRGLTRCSVLGKNGMIYSIPGVDPYIIKLNPNNDTYTSIQCVSEYNGGIVAPNGIIYGMPYFNNTILKFNPENETWAMFSGNNGDKFGAVLGNNGFIYGIPKSGKILKINPNNDTAIEIGASIASYQSWFGGVAVPSKSVIYGIPYEDSRILKITTYYDV